jgi:hypothetical protein
MKTSLGSVLEEPNEEEQVHIFFVSFWAAIVLLIKLSI